MTLVAPREELLTFANRVADIARGNVGVVDPDHVPATCEVCNQIADELAALIGLQPLASLVAPPQDEAEYVDGWLEEVILDLGIGLTVA